MILPRRGPQRRIILLATLLTFVAILVVATIGAGAAKQRILNDPKDERNARLGEQNGANPVNDCLSHHRGEGMYDTVVANPILPLMLKVGARSVVQVQIINPWKHELRNMSLSVKLVGAPLMTVEGAEQDEAQAQDLKLQFHRVLGPVNDAPLTAADRNKPPPEASPRIAFDLPANAVGYSAMVILVPSLNNTKLYELNPDEYTVKGPDVGDYFYPRNEKGQPIKTALERNYSAQVSGGGHQKFEIKHTKGYSNRTQVYVTVNIAVAATTSGKEYSVPVPFEKILKGKGNTVSFTVTPFAKGFQDMEFAVRAGAYYKHQDRSTPTLDFYTRYQVLNQANDTVTGSTLIPKRHVEVGDEYRAGALRTTSAGADIEEDFRLILGEVSGFSAATLLLPSLLLGGTYGKASRRFFNTILGGAKRRVMFHNLLSLGLSLVAVIHIALFMLEIRYTVLMGVLWGGIGALSLLILGLTGYYQVPLIQRHGYNWWRYAHLVFGILVVFAVSYHMIADGADFYFFKEQLPEWVNDINFSQK